MTFFSVIVDRAHYQQSGAPQDAEQERDDNKDSGVVDALK